MQTRIKNNMSGFRSRQHFACSFPPVRFGRRDGQAIVEFIVGLVAVLVLFAGLMQVASLTKTHTDTMVNARRLAAQQAMIDVDGPTSPDYIEDWRVGSDRKPYTRDDGFGTGDAVAFNDRIVDKAAMAPDWSVVDGITGNRISGLHGQAAPVSLFGLVRGADSRSVDLLPAVQHLIYDAPSIRVRCDVWMPRTKGLY